MNFGIASNEMERDITGLRNEEREKARERENERERERTRGWMWPE